MQLPILRYDGPVQVLASAAAMDDALREIRHERVVGFDTEARPTFRRGQVHPPSLVQIATGRMVYLFQLHQIDCSHTLAAVLGNTHLVKAGVAPGRDIIDLRKLFPLEPANVIDLAVIAKQHGFDKTGMRNLAGILLGHRVTKGAQTSNWARQNLSPAQVRYAATDAWVCRELYLRFEKLGSPPKSCPPVAGKTEHC